MFDDRSFSKYSFSPSSWLFPFVALYKFFRQTAVSLKDSTLFVLAKPSKKGEENG